MSKTFQTGLNVGSVLSAAPISSAGIKAEVVEALADIYLNYWMSLTTGDPDLTNWVADGCVLSRLMTIAGDTSDYDPTDDSSEAMGASINSINNLTTGDTYDLLNSTGALTDMAAGKPGEPGAMTIVELQSYLYAWLFNMQETTDITNGEFRVLRRDESTVMFERNISDNGTTYTRGEAGTED